MGRQRGSVGSPVIRAINALFPGYLDGTLFVCGTPADPAWHIAAGAHAGTVFDCNWPAPGAPGTGLYATFDCNAGIPA